jgi:MFS family permease
VSRRGPLAVFVVFGVFWGGWAALLPAVQAAVDASKGELGLTLLFVAAGSLPAMLVTGRAFDRRGARVLPGAVAAMAIAVVLPGLAGSVAALAAALLVVGLASGAVDVAMNGSVSELEARRDVRLMQLAHGLYSAGVMAGALAVGLAREAGAEPPAILAVIGALILAAALLNLGQPAVEPRASAPGRLGLRRAAVPFGIACGFAFVIEGGMENWGAVFLEQDLDAGPAASALAPAAYGAAMMLGRFSGHRLERRLGDTRLLAGAMCVTLVGLLAAALAPSVPVAVAAFFVGGAGISIAAPSLFGAGGRQAPPEARGHAVATVTTIGYLGFLVGPPIVGGVAEAVGLRASFLLLGCIAAALALAAPRLDLPGRRAS